MKQTLIMPRVLPIHIKTLLYLTMLGCLPRSLSNVYRNTDNRIACLAVTNMLIVSIFVNDSTLLHMCNIYDF